MIPDEATKAEPTPEPTPEPKPTSLPAAPRFGSDVDVHGERPPNELKGTVIEEAAE
jgi:hypothetical protein